MVSINLPLAIVAASALWQVKLSSACTAIAVGKDASSTGYPIVAHTEDSGPDTLDVRLVRVPRKQWPDGSRRPLYSWNDGYPRMVSTELRTPDYEPVDGEPLTQAIGHIPQVSETWAYWDTGYGVQNEWGLSIGESTCTARTVGWPANLPYGYNRVGIEDLTKIALERCKTALCAAETMGSIAVEQGFYSADSGDPSKPSYMGSSECLVLADATPGDVWVFNVMTGKHNASAIWAAQRMPSNHVTVVPNSFTIGEMNFSDSQNFVYSPGVSALAEEMGWWHPEQEAFNFYRAYGYTPSAADVGSDKVEFFTNVLAYYSGRRIWRVFSLLSPDEGSKLDPNNGNLPLTKVPYPRSVPTPKHTVTPLQLMDLLRDHYEGTPYDLTQGMAAGPFGNPNRAPVPEGVPGLWERAISMYRTTWSFVLEAKPRGRSVTWFSWDAPHGSVYLPFYGAATEPAPESYHSRDGHQSKFSNKVAFWAFSMVNQYQDTNFRLINADVRKKSHEVERDALMAIASWEAEADKIEGDEMAALALLTHRSNAFVNKVVEDWWQFAFSLFAKFGRYILTHNESSTDGQTVLRYPEWWLRSPEVGFTSWSAQGPFHGVLLDERIFLTARDKDFHDQMHAALQAQSHFLMVVFCVFALLSSGITGAIAHRHGARSAKRDCISDNSYYAVLP